VLGNRIAKQSSLSPGDNESYVYENGKVVYRYNSQNVLIARNLYDLSSNQLLVTDAFDGQGTFDVAAWVITDRQGSVTDLYTIKNGSATHEHVSYHLGGKLGKNASGQVVQTVSGIGNFSTKMFNVVLDRFAGRQLDDETGG